MLRDEEPDIGRTVGMRPKILIELFCGNELTQ
jgi:hypothetical protein